MDQDEFDTDVDEVCVKMAENVVPEIPTDLGAFIEYLKDWARRVTPKKTSDGG